MSSDDQVELRWIQRFSNFQRAFLLLGEVVNADIDLLTQLEQEGAIQRFEFTFELAWKVQKNMHEYNGVDISSVTPRQVLKEAFAANYIIDGQVWIDMLEMRNLLSHTYDNKVFKRALKRIKQNFGRTFRNFTSIAKAHSMHNDGLRSADREKIFTVLRQFSGVERAYLFGSRAMGNFKPYSDIDLALVGQLSDQQLAAISGDLEELPLPYKFDVIDLRKVELVALREHVAKHGREFYIA